MESGTRNYVFDMDSRARNGVLHIGSRSGNGVQQGFFNWAPGNGMGHWM